MLDIRLVYTGEFHSVQGYDLVRAPGSGWYEIAAFDNRDEAYFLLCHIARWLGGGGGMSLEEAEIIGRALTAARRNAYAQGVKDGIAAEKKRHSRTAC